MNFKVGDTVTYKGVMKERHGWVGKVIKIKSLECTYPIKVGWGRTWGMGTSCYCMETSLEVEPFGIKRHMEKQTLGYINE